MGHRGLIQLEADTRAARFSLAIPVRYRPPGEVGWNQSNTVNISRSGILFEVEERLDIDTPLEISFAVPPEIGGGGDGEAVCRGQVVRRRVPPGADEHLTVAAAIREFRLSLT